MPLQPNGHAPYGPPAAVTNVIDAFRDRGLGTPITLDVLVRAGVSESVAPRTGQAIKLLDLVDKTGNPTEQFEAIRQARGDEEFKALLQEWLRAVYADVLQYADPSKDGLDAIANAFRGYQPHGQRARMATLLSGLWQYAGLPVPQTKREPGERAPRAPRPTKRSTPPKARPYGGGPATPPSLGGLPAGLVGLLHQIPQDGGSWTSARRDEFVKAFTAVLDFSVPVDDSSQAVGLTADEKEVGAS